MEGTRSVFKVLSAKPIVKRPLGRVGHRWEDNVIIDTRNWIDSARDMDYWRALVNAALNLRVS